MVHRFAWQAVVVAALTAQAAAHSWVDCIDHSYDVVYTNSDKWVLTGTGGNGVCEGYGYKFPGRGVATIGTDYTHKLLPDDIARDAPVCQYHAKDADYTGWRKAVVAKPGDKLYFAYFSNGHVIKDGAGSGTTYGVYWSGLPDVELERPSQLTKERLVGELHDFDDGNCGETYLKDSQVPSGRAGDYKPCVGSFTIPLGTKPGTYPMVWWWTFFTPDELANNFKTFKGAGGAAYSSCFNVVVSESGSSSDRTSDAVTPTIGSVRSNDDVQGEADAVDPLAATATERIYSTSETTPVKCDVTADNKPTPTMKPASVNPEPPVMGSVHAASDQVGSDAAADFQTSAPVATTTMPAPSATTTTPVATTATPVAATRSVTPYATANIFAAPLSTVTITGVGGAGTYGKVTDMPCTGNGPSSDSCVQTPVAVSGPLAPFDEDLTLALRGPLEVDDIVVFTKSGDASQTSPWSKVSAYSHTQRNATQNMVFLNNKGDPAKSGEFSMCHGNSQSFATADGTTVAPEATAFDGKLADGVEVNVMSATSCASSGKTNAGFARGVAYEGWSGNHKIFMIKAQMPHVASGKDLPAIWLLNGQIVRSAEYGCNCRGMGDQGQWKGGCGELDVAEIISENKEMLTSTIYSFKGSRGTSPTMTRPVDGRVVFVVIFSASASNELGTVQILMMRPGDVDIENAPSEQRVTEWLSYRNGKVVDFAI